MKEKQLMKILVPTDGSPSSRIAVKTVAILATKTGARVTILHVIREADEYYRRLYAAQGLEHDIPYSLIRDLLKLTEKEAKVIVTNAQTFLKKKGVSLDVEMLRDSDPADSIIEFAKQDYDLIVMGARGKTEKDAWALGSVTKKVVRHTICPTLFTKKECTFSSILVCIDGSEHSIKALVYVWNLAEKTGAKITLLTVRERQSYVPLPSNSRVALKKLGQRILSNALKSIGKEMLEVETRVEFGVVPDKIVEIAEKGQHDLIVLGNRGFGTVKRFLLGSVSDDVIHKAKSSVLIVPAKYDELDKYTI